HISFLNFNYTSIKEPDSLVQFLASNQNALFTDHQVVADTDGDGLSDQAEFTLGTCAGLGPTGQCQNPVDSDGDYYSDFFEYAYRRSGFDPLDPKKPAQSCRAKSDSDGDGLRDCEEQFIQTDPRLFDTDGDRITDLQEILHGLNPLDANDAYGDAANDG